VTGVPVQVSAFNGYTDTAVIAGKLGNRECMSYGPGDLEMAHKPNEYVRIEEIIRCEKVLTQLAFQMTENQRRDSCK
jgi:succinyl-diaminopimelate desuccinylase